MKPILRLYDAVGTGLIICCESSVIISNQTGGHHCLQPEVEGVFVPIWNDCNVPELTLRSPEAELSAYFTGPKHRGAGAVQGLDDEDANFIDEVLFRFRLKQAIQVDRDLLPDSHEAWVHVSILSDESTDPNWSIFAGFGPYPRAGILTWSNSD